MSNLDSDSLRVEPLGHDRKNSAYWYFYGTRLYREDYIDTSNSASNKQKSKPRDKKRKRRRNRVAKKEQEEEEKEEASLINDENKERESVWQVVCFTQQDWSRLVEKFRDSVTITFITRVNTKLLKKGFKNSQYKVLKIVNIFLFPRRSTTLNANFIVHCPKASCRKYQNCST